MTTQEKLAYLIKTDLERAKKSGKLTSDIEDWGEVFLCWGEYDAESADCKECEMKNSCAGRYDI